MTKLQSREVVVGESGQPGKLGAKWKTLKSLPQLICNLEEESRRLEKLGGWGRSGEKLDEAATSRGCDLRNSTTLRSLAKAEACNLEKL